MEAHADRDRLIEIGLDVCARDGQQATLAGIATAAGISESELARQFASTEALVMAPADAMLDAVAAALADIEGDVKPIDVLQAAHTKVLSDIIAGAGPISRERMQAMGTAIMNTPDLQQRLAEHRKARLGPALAARLGVDVTDRRVVRGIQMWSAVLAATYISAPDTQGKFDPVDDARRPHRMHDRLTRAFRVITGR